MIKPCEGLTSDELVDELSCLGFGQIIYLISQIVKICSNICSNSSVHELYDKN